MEFNLKTKQSKLFGAVKMLLLFAVAAIAFTSCTKYGNDSYYNVQPVAGLNVVNASPGTASFNFALDNNFVNGAPILFGQRTAYINAYAGKRIFSLTSGGTMHVIATDTIAVAENGYYSMFITGDNSAPTFFFTQDDLTPPTVGKAKIRFVALSPDAGAFDLGIQGGATLFSHQAYKTASDFITVDPGEYHFQLKADNTGTVTPIDSVKINAGRIYTVWAKGLLAGADDTAISGKVSPNN